MSDADDVTNWLLDALLDLHDRAKGLIGNPKFFILCGSFSFVSFADYS